MFGARVDAWDESGGHQIEADKASDSLIGNERFATESGAECSPSAGLVWQPVVDLRIHANGQQAFSRPTLAEFYQPNGQDAIAVTEPNAGLQTERNTRRRGWEPSTPFTFGADRSKKNPEYLLTDPPILASGNIVCRCNRVFKRAARRNRQSQPYAGNRRVPIFGALPEGYVAQQLINLDRSRIQGVTGSVQWSPNSAFSAYASVVFSDSSIDRVGIAPGLVGKQNRRGSRRSCALSVRWRASDKTDCQEPACGRWSLQLPGR